MGRKFFFRNIFKTLRGVGHYIVYIILKTFFNIPIRLAVAASLPLHSSLILVLYLVVTICPPAYPISVLKAADFRAASASAPKL